MPIYVKNSGSFQEPSKIFIKNSGVWQECSAVYVKNSGVWQQAFINAVNITLSGLVKNLNVWDEVVSAIGSVAYPVIANVTLNSGCYVVGTSVTGYAFTAGSLPSGSIINLTLNSGAYLTGRGGNGGYGSNSENYGGQNGNAAGHAIYTRTPLVITNNGVIGGGGGGGGGGKGFQTYNAAGNGGGGAGGYHEATTAFAQSPSLGTSNRSISAGYGGLGAGVRGEVNTSPVASNGELSAGGAGGVSSEARFGGVYTNSRRGATGGNLGQDGGRGFGGASDVTGIAPETGYYGGLRGYAANGYSYITFVTTGTFLGRTTG